MKYTNCNICELRCRISEGQTGRCGRYELKNNVLQEKYPDQYLVACPISIETMPVLHFHPKAKFLQITTTGCNFNCPGCISTVLVREMSPDSSALQYLTPEQIVTRARETECEGIVFLMNDPIAAFPGFLKIAELAHTAGLMAGCSSNAYFTPEALDRLLPFLDFINIGMKGFSDEAYMACGVPGITPVLRNMKTIHAAGKHIEVSCILTKNNQNEIMDLARFIARISMDIPLQIMRFLPFETADISLEPSAVEAEDFCKEVHKVLDFVYLFNTPGSECLHTYCPRCDRLILKRDFYGPMGARVNMLQHHSQIDQCATCDSDLPIIGTLKQSAWQEGDFEGGYPFTRAMEIVESILIAMGVTEKDIIVGAWNEILQNGSLAKLHKDIQHPGTYIEMIRYFGKKANAVSRAETLALYLEDRLERIEVALARVSEKPAVYYAMCKPLFYINGGRLENQLVETAGGHSVNRSIPAGGRPGGAITVQELNRLNPEYIFISAFISSPVDDFYKGCLELGINADAVRNKKIFKHPAPGWDFGSPRWILGLMFIASVLHPEQCRFDVMKEAETFYEDFYGLPFDLKSINLSFSKPDQNWRWNE